MFETVPRTLSNMADCLKFSVGSPRPPVTAPGAVHLRGTRLYAVVPTRPKDLGRVAPL